MGKGDKTTKQKDGATVSHVNPFNSVDLEDAAEPAAVDKAGSGETKRQAKGGKGKKKKSGWAGHASDAGKTATAEAAEDEEGTVCSNPALLVESPRADAAAGQGASDDEQSAAGDDQSGAERAVKKGRMRAYLDRKEEAFREQERAKALEAKRQARSMRESEARKQAESKGTKVDNPFTMDDSSDEDTGGGDVEADDQAEQAQRAPATAISSNTSTFNPMQIDMTDGDDGDDDDDDQRWLNTAMHTGSVLEDVPGPAPEDNRTFKVKQNAWKGKKIRGHRVKASVSLIVSQMSMRIMDGDVLVCNILYQDVHDWEVGAPMDKGSKPTIDIALQGGSPTFAALGPLVRFASKHAAAIAAQLTYSITEFRELSGKAGYTPPAGASDSFADTEPASSPATAEPVAAEEGVPPEDAAASCEDDSAPHTVESLLSKVDETTRDLDGLEDEIEKRDDMIEDMREKLDGRDAAIATLHAQMAVLKHENAALKASLADAQTGGKAAASGFVAAATNNDEVSVDSIFAAAREADAAVRAHKSPPLPMSPRRNPNKLACGLAY